MACVTCAPKVGSLAQAPLLPLFAFTSPGAAAAWQAVNDGVMGGVSDGRSDLSALEHWTDALAEVDRALAEVKIGEFRLAMRLDEVHHGKAVVLGGRQYSVCELSFGRSHGRTIADDLKKNLDVQ